MPTIKRSVGRFNASSVYNHGKKYLQTKYKDDCEYVSNTKQSIYTNYKLSSGERFSIKVIGVKLHEESVSFKVLSTSEVKKHS